MVDKKEIWYTADGKEFLTKEEALLHEKELRDPDYQIKSELADLRKRVEHLEAENLKRIAEIEVAKNPFGVLNKKDTQRPATWPDGWPKIYYGAYNGTPKDILDEIDHFFCEPTKKGDQK